MPFFVLKLDIMFCGYGKAFGLRKRNLPERCAEAPRIIDLLLYDSIVIGEVIDQYYGRRS